jgi:hypothetical protein
MTKRAMRDRHGHREDRSRRGKAGRITYLGRPSRLALGGRAKWNTKSCFPPHPIQQAAAVELCTSPGCLQSFSSSFSFSISERWVGEKRAMGDGHGPPRAVAAEEVKRDALRTYS